MTAVTAGRQGTLHVTVVTAGNEQRRVEVRELTSGGGYVAVDPVQADALRPGDQVVTGVTTERSAPSGAAERDGEATSS